VLISSNAIQNNFYGIFIEGRVDPTLRNNHFHNVVVPVKVI